MTLQSKRNKGFKKQSTTRQAEVKGPFSIVNNQDITDEDINKLKMMCQKYYNDCSFLKQQISRANKSHKDKNKQKGMMNRDRIKQALNPKHPKKIRMQRRKQLGLSQEIVKNYSLRKINKINKNNKDLHIFTNDFVTNNK